MLFLETLLLSAIHSPLLGFPVARIHLLFLVFMFLGCSLLSTFLLHSVWQYFSVSGGFFLLLGFGLASPGLFLFVCLFGRTEFLALYT